MRTIDDIRHERLLELIREAGSVQALADRLGKSHSQISQLKTRARYNAAGGRKSVGTTLAREIERTMELPEGWMDTDPQAQVCNHSAPAECREQPEARPASPVNQSVWRGAAMQLLQECKARGLTLDAETFMDVVDVAVEEAGEDANRVFKTWLPILARGRAIGHAAP